MPDPGTGLSASSAGPIGSLESIPCNVTFPDRMPVAFQMGLFSTRRDDLVLIELTSHQPDLQAFVRSLMPGDASAADVVQQANLVV